MPFEPESPLGFSGSTQISAERSLHVHRKDSHNDAIQFETCMATTIKRPVDTRFRATLDSAKSGHERLDEVDAGTFRFHLTIANTSSKELCEHTATKVLRYTVKMATAQQDEKVGMLLAQLPRPHTATERSGYSQPRRLQIAGSNE